MKMDRQIKQIIVLWLLVALAAGGAAYFWWNRRPAVKDSWDEPAASTKIYHITVNVGTPGELRYETIGEVVQKGPSTWEFIERQSKKKMIVSGTVIIQEASR